MLRTLGFVERTAAWSTAKGMQELAEYTENTERKRNTRVRGAPRDAVERAERQSARSAAERAEHAEHHGATQSTWSTAIPQSAAECAERIGKPRSLPECHEVLRSAQIA